MASIHNICEFEKSPISEQYGIFSNILYPNAHKCHKFSEGLHTVRIRS